MYVWVPEVGNTADTLNPLGYYPFKGNLGKLYFYIICTLTMIHEASTGAGWGNLGSESWLMYK